MKIIEISDLSVKYGDGDNFALKGVNLDIFSTDFIGVIGPNGGGKTTLVKTILGLIQYSSGSVKFTNNLTLGTSINIGYLPQDHGFDPNFPISVTNVVMSGLLSRKGLIGGYGSEDKLKAQALMKIAGISSIANRSVSELSGGELQRALLCRAVISDPQILILDEPANFVDNKFEKELYELLREFNKRMAIIMVSHDIGTISSVVKQIVCVNKTVHRHESNVITNEQLYNYDCPIQLLTHGKIPHTVLKLHEE